MPCDRCPVRPDAPNPCLGAVHPPACGYVAAGRAEWVAHLIALAEGRTPADPGRIDVRLAMAADLCPMGVGCGCGDRPRLCGHPDRPLEVFRRDCIECVTADPPDPGARP